MEKFLIAIPLVFFISHQAFAGCSATRDYAGNVEVECDDGTSGTLREDSFGNTRGYLGDDHYETKTDSYGNTRGYYGDDEIDLRTNRYGTTSGTVGGRDYDDSTCTRSYNGRSVDCY